MKETRQLRELYLLDNRRRRGEKRQNRQRCLNIRLLQNSKILNILHFDDELWNLTPIGLGTDVLWKNAHSVALVFAKIVGLFDIKIVYGVL